MPKIYQISELNQRLRTRLESEFRDIWIEGELSSLATPASGHIYFSLKDETAQLRCVMFKGRLLASSYKPRAGDLVRIQGSISLYTARGDLQCLVSRISESGEGLLQRQFLLQKKQLEAQGLFDPRHKKTLPTLAKKVGIISSPTGAAVRDVIQTLGRRCESIGVIIYPCLVQGEKAAESIRQALLLAQEHAKCDALIVARGGGSMEDLWPFNDALLCQAIYDCELPIVAGIGHEVDTTLADLTADVRAATPTAAAELLSPLRTQMLRQVAELSNRLRSSIHTYVREHGQRLDMQQLRLKHPRETIKQRTHTTMALHQRLAVSFSNAQHRRQLQFQLLRQRLLEQHPESNLEKASTSVASLAKRCRLSNRHRVETEKRKLSGLAQTLAVVNPLATLNRGFCIARNAQSQIVRESKASAVGDRIDLKLSRGELICHVDEVIIDEVIVDER